LPEPAKWDVSRAAGFCSTVVAWDNQKLPIFDPSGSLYELEITLA